MADILIIGFSHDPEDTLAPWGRAGSVLERAIRRCGFYRNQFTVWEHGTREDIVKLAPRVILALGGVAIELCTGLAGPKLGVSNLTGYYLPGYMVNGIPTVAMFHPAFIRKGRMSLMGVLMRAIKVAVSKARSHELPIEPPVDSPPKGYILHPDPYKAGDFLCAVKSGNWTHLAYDIETPYSVDEEAAEEHAPGAIDSIQFSLSPGTGIFMPWREPYITIAKQALATRLPKLNWNGWKFDDPLLAMNGVKIEGENHDCMWMWHAAQPDLPRGLQFAMGQMGHTWPWKHLNNASPEFYGIVDVDVLQTYIVGA